MSQKRNDEMVKQKKVEKVMKMVFKYSTNFYITE